MKRKAFGKVLASLIAASMVMSMAACGDKEEESRGVIPIRIPARPLKVPARPPKTPARPPRNPARLPKRIWELTPSERMPTETRSIWAAFILLSVTGLRIPTQRLLLPLSEMPETPTASGCRRPIISPWSRRPSVRGSLFLKISPTM